MTVYSYAFTTPLPLPISHSIQSQSISSKPLRPFIPIASARQTNENKPTTPTPSNSNSFSSFALSEDYPTKSSPPLSIPSDQTYTAHIVLICGFETFNLQTYYLAVQRLQSLGIKVTLATDNQLNSQHSFLIDALNTADAVFCSLVFDYDQVEWLRAQLSPSATIFVFESALELMSETRVGSFEMKSPADGKQSGMPPGIKVVLRKLGIIGREEDKLAGYLSLLKNAPRLLKLVPGKKAKDLRNWLTVYSYWNGGGTDNVVSMMEYITTEVLQRPKQDKNGNVLETNIQQVVQIPNIGLVHPQRPDYFFEHPAEYVAWYEKTYPERKSWNKVALLLYRKHVVSNLSYIPKLIEYFEEAQIIPVPVFITGVEAHIIVRDYLTSETKERARKDGQRIYGSNRRGKKAFVDAVVSTIGFPLVGGPAGSMAGGRIAGVGQLILRQLNVPYVVAAPLLIQDLHSWKKNGVAGLQSVVLYSLPELDGAIDTVCIGGLVGEEIYLIKDRVQRLTGRLKNWISLRNKQNADKKVAIVIYGFPPSIGATGTAALLNVPRSLSNILKSLKQEGYDVGEGDQLSADEILRRVKESDEVLQGGQLTGSSAREALELITTVDSADVKEWLGQRDTQRIEKAWNGDLGQSSNIKTFDKSHLLGGVQFGNIWIGVQPPLGVVGDPMRMMFERDLTPHPQYAAFYRWLENGFGADATIHVGTHGTYEWLPGNPLGNTNENWSDIFMGNMPNLYVYAANNPSEGSLAKRRGYATIISHNVPPYGRAALYGQLEELKNLVWSFNEAMQESKDSDRIDDIRKSIEEKMITSGLIVDLGLNPDDLSSTDFVAEVSAYLKTLESRLFSSGLHVLGQNPNFEEAVGFVEAILGDEPETVPEEARLSLAKRIALNTLGNISDEGNGIMSVDDFRKFEELEVIKKAAAVVEKLSETENELNNIVRGLNGEFIEALPGGDVLRDGISVLPTGSNIHALDPYRLPSPAAFTTGRAIAERVIQTHMDANDGQYPETMAVPLWGLDNIKTKGESVGIVLGLLGAKPLLDGTGRVVRFELIPLKELGRPRVDVLMNLSGIFRDSFEHVVYLLDDLCRRASQVDEPVDQNFIRKHYQNMSTSEKDADSGARIFSNPPGDYGSMVNEQVADATWENGDELAETYVNRNSYIYGRNSNGKADKSTLKKLLSTTSRVVQQIDSVEYGLSDIQEYYANTGALLRAARVENKSTKVGASIVESFGAARDGGAGREPKELEQVLRMELRTRLLNPKWAEKMIENGAGGAFEVSTRMTALVGWGGTANYGDDFVFEQAAERYVLDEKMRDKLRSSSPEAFRNVLARFLEAAGRGIWSNPDEKLLETIRDQLDNVDSELEGIDV